MMHDPWVFMEAFLGFLLVAVIALGIAGSLAVDRTPTERRLDGTYVHLLAAFCVFLGSMGFAVLALVIAIVNFSNQPVY